MLEAQKVIEQIEAEAAKQIPKAMMALFHSRHFGAEVSPLWTTVLSLLFPPLLVTLRKNDGKYFALASFELSLSWN